MRRANIHQLLDRIDEIEDALARIRVLGPVLLHRAKAGGLTNDGWPPRTGEGGRPAGSHADPTASMALAPERHDPVRAAALQLSSSLEVAVQALRKADAAAQEGATDEPPSADSNLAPVIPLRGHISFCVNCLEQALPRARAGRCPACYVYRLRHAGADRPVDGARREAV